MEQELIKHTENIIEAAKEPKHGFWKTFREIFLEIAIIVFAVTISIWFHNIADHRHENREARKFLIGLKEDLTNDIAALQSNRSVITKLESNYKYILSHADKNAPDSVIAGLLYFDLRVTRPTIGRYEGFKSSGKIESIENDSIKENILKFYHQVIPTLVYGENFVNDVQLKILDLRVNSNEQQSTIEFVNIFRTKALLSLGAQNYAVNIEGYNEAIKIAGDIIAQIDEEMK